MLFSRARLPLSFPFFFFNDTATTEIYTLSLHDALPISLQRPEATQGVAIVGMNSQRAAQVRGGSLEVAALQLEVRSEEHTSELQSQSNLVCRLLLEKKKKHNQPTDRRPRPNSTTEHSVE